MNGTRRFRWRSRVAAVFAMTALLAAGLPVGLSGPPAVRAGAATGPPTITTFWLTNVTQTNATFYFETDQPAQGYMDYGATSKLGRIRPRSIPPEGTQHTIPVDNLSPNTLYYYKARAVNAFGQDTTEVFTFRTPPASATARLIVTKKNPDAVTLAGACFALFKDAGQGALGDFVDSDCDRYDTAPNDGQVIFPALDPVRHVLVETRSPYGYALAGNTRFTAVAGTTRHLTVTDGEGGARITITKRDEQDRLVPGACFVVSRLVNGQVGADVAWQCDDYDGDDGITTLGNLGTGTYWLWESYTPPGYLGDVGREITIASGQRTLDIAFSNPTQQGRDNVEFQSISSTGALIPGACFIIFGDVTRSACDWDDGANDGRTFFGNVEPGTYEALEYRAPIGHQVGKRASFTKVDDRFKRLRYTQVAGGVPLTVTTLKGSTTAKLPGACYALFRKVSSGPYPAVAFWCDFEDGTNDGITRFLGIRPGTYLLEQYYTPPGYAKPQDREITVGSAGARTTVRTATGVSAASLDGGMVSAKYPTAARPTATATPSPTPTGTPTAPAATATPVVTETAQPTETPTIEPTPTEVPNASPVANAGPDQALTDADGSGAENVTLDGSGSADPEGGELTYRWTLNGNVIATTATSVVELSAGTHTVHLIVTDDAGATGTDDVAITIAPAPAPVATTEPDADAVGGGDG